MSSLELLPYGNPRFSSLKEKPGSHITDKRFLVTGLCEFKCVRFTRVILKVPTTVFQPNHCFIALNNTMTQLEVW